MDGIIEYFKPLYNILYAIIEFHIIVYKPLFCGSNILGMIFGLFLAACELAVITWPVAYKNSKSSWPFGGGGGFAAPPGGGSGS